MPLNTLPIRALVKVPNIGLKGKQLKRDFRAYMKSIQVEIEEMGKQVIRDAIVFTGAVATGKLLKSVTSRLVANPSIDGFTRQFTFKKPGSEYAYFADQGRDPGGAPPYAAIARWARAKGIDKSAVNKIRYSIAEYGTEGHEFMEISEPIIEKKSNKIIEKGLRKYVSLTK